MFAAGIGLVVAVGVAGCGEAQKLSAKDSVTDAMSSFEDAKSATFTVSLESTSADIAAISKAQGEEMSATDTATFDKILAGDVVFAVAAADGKTFGESATTGADLTGSADATTLLKDPEKLGELLKKQGSFSMAVRQDGSDLVDLRSIDGVIYVRADVAKVLTLAGEDASVLDEQLSALPPSMEPLAKAAKGEWVSLDLVKAATAAKDSGLLDALPTATASPSVDAAKVQKLIDSLQTAYQDKATITEVGEDEERGTGYRLGAPAKQVAQAVSDDLIALVGKASEEEIRKTITEIPDKTFSLDVWVKDDKLTAVSLDLVQFMDKPVDGKKLAIDVAIDLDSGEVSAPSGATEIDLSALLSEIPAGALTGATATTSDTSLSSGLDSSTDPSALTDEQLEELKAQTGMTEEELTDLMGTSGQ